MRDDDRPFLTTIAAAPDDDTPRLVFADHLDETGRPEWAELIRLQVEQARLKHRHRAGDKSCRKCQLDRASLGLMSKLGDSLGLSGLTGMPVNEYVYRSKRFAEVYENAVCDELRRESAGRVALSRGMPSVVFCRLSQWVTHGPEMVAHLPIERVRPTDRHPDWRRLSSQPGGMHFWYRLPVTCPPDATDLPAEIFDRLDPDVTDRAGDDEFRGHYGYNERIISEALWDDLSRALIEWAKDESRRLGLVKSVTDP